MVAFVTVSSPGRTVPLYWHKNFGCHAENVTLATDMKKHSFLVSITLSILAIVGNCVFPVRITPKVKFGDNICSNDDGRDALLNLAKEDIKNAIMNDVNPIINSCGSFGWTKVAYLNMSDPSATCPSNWTVHNSPRGCGRRSSLIYACDSTIFPVGGLTYSSVCGRILAHQRGSTDAFRNPISFGFTTIDSAYVDGISVTHGPVGSRQHIWTFASAIYEEDPSYQTRWNCACTNTRYNWPHQLPSFIQNNYFCDTGNPGPGFSLTAYYTTDPLWDGEGCGDHNSCCQFNNPPWFKATLPQETSDNIELRLCYGEGSHNEDTIVYLIEIYLQ